MLEAIAAGGNKSHQFTCIVIILINNYSMTVPLLYCTVHMFGYSDSL
jgi:hypothetical protein